MTCRKASAVERLNGAGAKLDSNGVDKQGSPPYAS